MGTNPTGKQRAWPAFDRIVAQHLKDGAYTNPWVGQGETAEYRPDYDALQELLGVPLYLRTNSQSGVPALALDVWVAYELRRAGFDPNAIWPRDEHPRVVSQAIYELGHPVARSKGAPLRREVWDLLAKATSFKGITSSTARVLGKSYTKQVDVVMSDWTTGPEILISTKRMDSSFGNNAANRVEESYGDAKNLRQRHPLAALGFVYALRSTILNQKPREDRVGWADWLMDLIRKLGREDDAYHATCYLVLEWDKKYDVDEPADSTSVVGEDEAESAAGAEEELPELAASEVDEILDNLPDVRVRFDAMPEDLRPSAFFPLIINRVLANTPVEMHSDARFRRDGEYQRKTYPPEPWLSSSDS